MLAIGAVDNQTICDLFGVANTGGIRVNINRNLIVLISNNTDPAYKNEWRDEVLHFVGGGSGDQTLTRQNKTLANAAKNSAKLHLFEVFEKKKYVYAGMVELASEPYETQQAEKSGETRTVWVFPLRKRSEQPTADEPRKELGFHLPYGAYALIADDLTPEQRTLVHAKLDELAAAGVTIIDKRDVVAGRIGVKLSQWNDASLAKLRSLARARIAELRKNYRVARKEFAFEPDEILIDGQSDEKRIREVLEFVGIPDEFEGLRLKAFDSIDLPNMDGLAETASNIDPSDMKPMNRRLKIDPDKLKDIT